MSNEFSSDVFLGELLDTLPDAVVWVRPIYAESQNGANKITDFEIVFANRRGIELAGSPNGTLRGKRVVADSLPGTVSREVVFLQYLEVFESGKSQEYTYFNANLNRHIDVLRIKLANGILNITRDRDRDKAASLERQQENELLFQVINASPTAIMLLELTGSKEEGLKDFRPVLVNRQAAKITGLSFDEITSMGIGRRFQEFFDNGLIDVFTEVLESGKRSEGSVQIETFGGWHKVLVEPQSEGRIVAVFLNINELKDAELDLQQSADYLKNVIDNSLAGIFIFTPEKNEQGSVVDFRFRLVNPAVASYIKKEVGQIIGSLGSDWFPSYKENGLFDRFLHTYHTGESQRFNFHYQSESMNAWLEVMVIRLSDEILVSFSDHTELKQLQQQLESSVAELRRSNQNLEQFAFVASHDLQEPLRKIETFGNILMGRHAQELGDEPKDLIRRMQSAAMRMGTLILDLLSFSRVSSQKPAFVEVDTAKLVQEVLSDLETAIRDKQAEIEVGQLYPIIADPLQLRQMFQNLVSNSLKFVQPGKTPRISVSAQKVRGNVSGFAVRDEDLEKEFQLIEISDNGIGFEQQYAERIFQIFQRLHGRSEYPGTGVGLTIVMKVVQNHSGYISSTGRPGEGAVFKILLPLAPSGNVL